MAFGWHPAEAFLKQQPVWSKLYGQGCHDAAGSGSSKLAHVLAQSHCCPPEQVPWPWQVEPTPESAVHVGVVGVGGAGVGGAGVGGAGAGVGGAGVGGAGVGGQAQPTSPGFEGHFHVFLQSAAAAQQ
jgi:hypothetical protein